MALTRQESSLKPLIELTIASVIWGFGFVGTIWALQSLSIPAIMIYRFFGAFLVGACVWIFTRPRWDDLKHELMISRGAAFWLGATLVLQTWGLLTTSATKSAFITVLYVVFTPLITFLLDGEKLSLRNTFCLAVALGGTAMIVDFSPTEFNLGDLLTLGNAITAAFHIRIMSIVAPKSRNYFNFNLGQCFWTGVFCLPLALLSLTNPGLFQGGWSLFNLSTRAATGLFCVTIGSSLIAFYLQVRAQRRISASVAALLFLMESPFSAFFGAWLLHETLSSFQLIGAGLIFGSCALASLPRKLPAGAHP